jgi:hypothetical protein
MVAKAMSTFRSKQTSIRIMMVKVMFLEQTNKQTCNGKNINFKNKQQMIKQKYQMLIKFTLFTIF